MNMEHGHPAESPPPPQLDPPFTTSTMAAADVQAYLMPRHEDESARLELQHKVWSEITGYLLHPTIRSNLPESARIAEVGTGTGAWSQDLVQHSPSTWHVTGFDVSDAQFPQAPSDRIDFKVLDILGSVPQEHQGQYDVVHLRLLTAAMTAELWPTAARNVRKLLRPGGWVQWQEGNFGDIQIITSEPGVPTSFHQKLANMSIGSSQKHGKLNDEVTRLEQIIQDAGFSDCMTDAISSDRVPHLRQKFNGTQMAGMSSVVRMMAVRDPELGWTEKEVEDVIDGAYSEVAEGKQYQKCDLNVIIGRRTS